MSGCSSGTISVATTEKLRCLSASATAGPERSARSPRDEESLTVRTAAVRVSGVEEDIFFLLRFVTVPLGRLIEQAQAFHQQALSVELSGLCGGLTLEIDLEVAFRPAQHLEHGCVAHERPINRVCHLALADVHFALLVFVGQGERTALAAHFQGLYKIDHIHL